MDRTKYRIVLVENNVADVMIISLALREAAPCDITVLSDGEKAFQYFQSVVMDSKTFPELVILDLNLPIRDGTEVLDFIRSHTRLSAIPVAVVSSSPRDVMKGRAARADCYVTKSTDLDKYLAIGKELVECIKRSEGQNVVPGNSI